MTHSETSERSITFSHFVLKFFLKLRFNLQPAFINLIILHDTHFF